MLMRSMSCIRCSYQETTVHKITASKDPITVLIYLYLPHSEWSHMTGVFRLHIGLVAKALGLTSEQCECALSNLVELDLIEYDKENSLVYFINEWLRQSGTDGTGRVNSLNTIKSGQHHIAQLIRSPVARQFIADHSLNVDIGNYPKAVKKRDRGWSISENNSGSAAVVGKDLGKGLSKDLSKGPSKGATLPPPQPTPPPSPSSMLPEIPKSFSEDENDD